MKLTKIISSSILLLSLTGFIGCGYDSNVSSRYRHYFDTNKNGNYDVLVTGVNKANILKGNTKISETISYSDTTTLKEELSKEEILQFSPPECGEEVTFH